MNEPGRPDDEEVRPIRPSSMPRWVKVGGAVALALLLLVVILLIVGGEHGPGRHF